MFNYATYTGTKNNGMIDTYSVKSNNVTTPSPLFDYISTTFCINQRCTEEGQKANKGCTAGANSVHVLSQFFGRMKQKILGNFSFLFELDAILHAQFLGNCMLKEVYGR